MTMNKSVTGQGRPMLFAGAALAWLVLIQTAPVCAQPAPPPTAAMPAKKPVRTQDDLPRHSYPVAGTAVALLNADDATFNAWAAKVNADVDATLAGYDIQDHATLRKLLGLRLNYQLLTGDDRGALTTIAAIRAVQDKPDAKLTSGLRSEAIVKARIATGASSGPGYEQAFAANYAAALDALPWAVTGNALKESKRSLQVMTPALVEGVIKSEVEPVVARERAVSDQPADDLIWARMMRRVELPLQPLSLAAVSKVVAAKNVMKPDIWAARDVTLTAADRPTPVVAAVWDSGTDVALFPGQLYSDPKPVAPNHEHGLAFDIDSKPQPGWLYPLNPSQQAEYPKIVADFQGFTDLEQSIDSPAAAALRTKIQALPSDRVPAFFETLQFYGNYIHGTHVAGIVARGNPAIRLASARMTFDWRNVPVPPTEQRQRDTVAMYDRTIAWFRAHKVRVVNMSWGGTTAGIESALEKNGVGKDVATRKALARRLFVIERDGLYAAIKGAPEILFVAAAGNSDSDNAFDEAIPSSFVLPNLLTVSAVDRGGDEASFTTYGKNVAVSANGYQVPSVVPGGTTLMESGTSMASPNVANLAAKLLALKPSLTPEQTIALIKAGATPSEDGRRNNIDPKRSVALLKQQR